MDLEKLSRIKIDVEPWNTDLETPHDIAMFAYAFSRFLLELKAQGITDEVILGEVLTEASTQDNAKWKD